MQYSIMLAHLIYTAFIEFSKTPVRMFIYSTETKANSNYMKVISTLFTKSNKIIG